ncbi:MAG: cyclic nucleotide-binding domain-containing protein [Burkholderiales bacterium]
MLAPPDFQALCKTALARELSEADCRVLAALVHAGRLKDGEIVCEEGKADNRLHMVLRGALGVALREPDGSWRNLHVKTAGELVGELSFLDGMPHYAALRALGDTEILSLPRESLEGILQEHPWIVYRVMRAILRDTHSLQRSMSMQAIELTNYIFKQHGRY